MAWLAADPVTASAFSQARYQLQHTAFIELNQQAVVESRYREASFRTFWGFRILAIDGSKVLLPDTEDVREAFGTIAYSNGKDAQIQGERPYALASVLYDVLNRIALDATMGRADADEVDLAIGHLTHTGPTDLLVIARPGNTLDRSGTGATRCERNPSSPDGQSDGLLQCHQAPRLGPVVERLGHPTVDRAVDRVVSDPSDLRAAAAPSAPSENVRQSLAEFPSSTEKALLLKEIRLT